MPCCGGQTADTINKRGTVTVTVRDSFLSVPQLQFLTAIILNVVKESVCCSWQPKL